MWWLLMFGATVVLAWAWFLFSFLGEPSAVGRLRVGLLLIVGYCLLTAILTVIAASRLRSAQGWRLALAAAVALTFTGVGALVGIPVLIELFSRRRLS